MLLGDIIKSYRNKHNMSMQKFADLIGSSKSYISMIEKNLNPTTGKAINPSLETLKLISEAINIDLNNLLKQLNDEQEIYINEDKYKEQFKLYKRIPVLGSIPAGVPIELIEDIIDYEDISEDMLKGNQEYFALQIKGDSMSPQYLDKDILIVLQSENCESGQDCVVMVNGYDGTFKRIYKNATGITLQPLNNIYEPQFFTNKEIKELPVKILGIVKEIRRKI